MFIIGERINPAGKPKFARAIRVGNFDFIREEAREQERAGADAIDVNVFLPDLDRIPVMRAAVRAVLCVSRLPLSIDDQDPEVIEAGLQLLDAPVFMNSPADSEVGDPNLFSLVKRFGADWLVLPLKGGQIPQDTKEHLKASRTILKRAEEFGIPKDCLVIDAVLLALKQAGSAVLRTLETIEQLKGELEVRTVLGLSNVSYGLRNREELNARFLALAKKKGLDVVICDPLQKTVMEVVGQKDSNSFSSDEKRFLEFAETCRM